MCAFHTLVNGNISESSLFGFNGDVNKSLIQLRDIFDGKIEFRFFLKCFNTIKWCLIFAVDDRYN